MSTVELHTLVYLVNPFTASNRNDSTAAIENGDNSSYNDTSDLVPMKRILYWTKFHEVKDFPTVVFHVRNLPQVFPYHDPQQRWIFFLMESPVHTYTDYMFSDVFNWTMTYRLDSDIMLPYGTFTEKSAEQKAQSAKSLSKNHAVGRNKMMSWFVSHCRTDSKREDLAKELSMYIEVHIYGGCGKPCDKLCAKKLSKEYKFFLAFENSLCKDYVTEKFFKVAEEGMGIPVVFGGGNYFRIAPPKSYIDARNFKTPKDLANYLLVVAGDDKLYNGISSLISPKREGEAYGLLGVSLLNPG